MTLFTRARVLPASRRAKVAAHQSSAATRHGPTAKRRGALTPLRPERQTLLPIFSGSPYWTTPDARGRRATSGPRTTTRRDLDLHVPPYGRATQGPACSAATATRRFRRRGAPSRVRRGPARATTNRHVQGSRSTTVRGEQGSDSEICAEAEAKAAAAAPAPAPAAAPRRRPPAPPPAAAPPTPAAPGRVRDVARCPLEARAPRRGRTAGP